MPLDPQATTGVLKRKRLSIAHSVPCMEGCQVGSQPSNFIEMRSKMRTSVQLKTWYNFSDAMRRQLRERSKKSQIRDDLTYMKAIRATLGSS